MFISKNNYNKLLSSYEDLKKLFDEQEEHYKYLSSIKNNINIYNIENYICLSKAYVEFNNSNNRNNNFEIEYDDEPIKFYKSNNNLIYINNKIIHTINLENVKYYSNQLAKICKDNCYGCINFNHNKCEKGNIKL